MRKDKFKKQEGYALVEIIVALGVFISVMFIGMGSIVAIFGAYKRSQDLETIISDLNFTLDAMSREIVVGTRYHCGSGNADGATNFPEQDCASNGEDWITFCSSEGQRIFYRYSGAQDDFLERAIIENSNCVLDDDEDWFIDPSPTDWLRVSTTEVDINNADFYISGASGPQSDFLQTRVLIYLEGIAGPSYAQTDFAIQTTVSQRAPNLSILSTP